MPDRLSSTLSALADPTRRAILARLATGEATVNQLAEPFDISLPAISRHLKVLQKAGLIRYVRGRVTVIDRAGLERACCECYGIITSAFARILEQRRVPSPLEELTISEGGKSIAGEGAPTVPHTVDAQ